MSEQPESTPPPPAASQGSTAKVKEGAKKAYAEGQARRVVVKKEGHTYYDVSLLITVIFALFAPWVAIAALILAVVTGCDVKFTNLGGGDEAESAEAPGDDTTLAS